jgi:hypothetical protein
MAAFLVPHSLSPGLGCVDGILESRSLGDAKIDQQSLDRVFILIPTTRRPELTRALLSTIATIGCRKVVLVSDRDDENVYRHRLMCDPTVQVVTLEQMRRDCLAKLRRNKNAELLRAITAGNSSQRRVWDLPAKRNIGLMYGALHGFDKLILLDDDISNINSELLKNALIVSTGLALLGVLIDHFPDLSVIEHIRWRLYREYEPFIAGNCLIIDLKQTCGYFPRLYNEDWLFIFAHPKQRVGFVSNWFIHQQEYDPFKPEKAIWQEFGDTVAEGMFDAWSSDRIEESTTIDFWDSFSKQRKNSLRDIRCDLVGMPAQNEPRMLECIEAAHLRSCEFRPRDLLDFMQRSRTSSEQYSQMLLELRGQFANGN